MQQCFARVSCLPANWLNLSFGLLLPNIPLLKHSLHLTLRPTSISFDQPLSALLQHLTVLSAPAHLSLHVWIPLSSHAQLDRLFNVDCSLVPAGNGMVPVNNMSMSNGSSMTSVGANGTASPSITGGNVIPQLPELSSSGLPGAAGPQGQYAINPPADGSTSGGDQQDPAYIAKQRQKKHEFILKQQRWLLFLRHCAKCQYPDGQCNYGSSCAVAKQLWQHILGCSDARCEYPRCCICLTLYVSCVIKQREVMNQQFCFGELPNLDELASSETQTWRASVQVIACSAHAAFMIIVCMSRANMLNWHK